MAANAVAVSTTTSKMHDNDDDNNNNNVVLTNRIPLPSSNNDKYVLVITLNRPSKKNCFNTRVCHDLATVFYDAANEIEGYDLTSITSEEEEEEEESGSGDENDNENDHHQQQLAAIILTGSGTSFCAGADLSDPPNPLHQSSDLPHHLRWNPVHQMGRVGVPIIGVLRGHVITGGFELALACDILLGSPTTSFRDTHVKFGLAPCWGLSQKLCRRIGPGRARMVSFSARPVKARKAYEWGLLDELVDDSDDNDDGGGGRGALSLSPISSSIQNEQIPNMDAVLLRAISLADTIATNDATMVRRYKRAIVEGSHMDFGKGMQRERELGLGHYLEVVGDGTTFEDAKEFVEDGGRRRGRMGSKL